MARLWIAQNQSGWVAQTFITDDSEAIDARVNQQVIGEQTKGQPLGW